MRRAARVVRFGGNAQPPTTVNAANANTGRATHPTAGPMVCELRPRVSAAADGARPTRAVETEAKEWGAAVGEEVVGDEDVPKTTASCCGRPPPKTASRCTTRPGRCCGRAAPLRRRNLAPRRRARARPRVDGARQGQRRRGGGGGRAGGGGRGAEADARAEATSGCARRGRPPPTPPPARRARRSRRCCA